MKLTSKEISFLHENDHEKIYRYDQSKRAVSAVVYSIDLKNLTKAEYKVWLSLDKKLSK